MDQDTGEQQSTRTDLDHDITHAGAIGALVARRPDQEYRSDRNAFPENEKGRQIASEDGADCAASIDEAGGLLEAIAHMQRIKATEKRGQ